MTSPKKLWETLVKNSAKDPAKIEVTKETQVDMMKNLRDLSDLQKLSAEQKKAMRQQFREDTKTLNLRWMNEMINSEAQLREKMSLSWHGHFACRVINVFYQQQLLDTVRTNALGKFSDLLKSISKSPAMLQFLNNQQNKKQHPNEISPAK